MKKSSPDFVLKTCKINTRPVDLELILRTYGIEKVDLTANDDIFGAILSENGRVVIAVNPNQHRNRQRFTIAHELGHFFCHYQGSEQVEHVDGDFRVHWRNSASSEGVNWKEIEANRFAASLLMPERLIRIDLDTLNVVDRDAVQDLASRYEVSRIAMQFRLVNLGILPPDIDPSGAA